MSVNATAGAFTGLAMGLKALATAILLPQLCSLVHQRKGKAAEVALRRIVTKS